MRIAEINTTIVDGYVGLLDNLSTSDKLDLISKLTTSVKSDSKKTAEQIIEEIRNSRVSTRQIESF